MISHSLWGLGWVVGRENVPWTTLLRNLMELRKTLHRTAYQHKTVKKLEQQRGRMTQRRGWNSKSPKMLSRQPKYWFFYQSICEGPGPTWKVRNVRTSAVAKAHDRHFKADLRLQEFNVPATASQCSYYTVGEKQEFCICFRLVVFFATFESVQCDGTLVIRSRIQGLTRFP